MNYSVILLAAGSGSRMNLGYNKMLMTLRGLPLIVRTAKIFFQDHNCKQIIYVSNPREHEKVQSVLIKHKVWDRRCSLVGGGTERQYSVQNGLNHIKEMVTLVHDGARPFITKKLIAELVTTANQKGCAIPAVRVKDTIKVVHNNIVSKTLPRELLYAVQTPQACKTNLLKLAHSEATTEGYLGTDEASLIEKYSNQDVYIINGSYDNIKITTQEDIKIANELIE